MRGAIRGRAAALVALALASCVSLPSPQRTQSARLLDQLVQARAALAQAPPDADAGCGAVATVQTRLTGEPGLRDVQPTWSELRETADALQAVCGQLRLLGLPAIDSPTVREAQERWRHCAAHELAEACRHLQAAAAALSTPTVACEPG